MLRPAISTEPAVTRADLISEFATSNPHLRIADAELIIATIFAQITAALVRGERVELRSFGAFTVEQRNARSGTIRAPHETVPGGREGGVVLHGRHGNALPAQWRWDEQHERRQVALSIAVTVAMPASLHRPQRLSASDGPGALMPARRR